jgi:hypothetical protein
MIEFQECAACAAKSGAPYLCAACLHNRALAGRLRELIELANQPLPLTTDEVRAALHAGHVERRMAEGDNAWTSLVRQRDEARALADQCAGVASGRKAAFEALPAEHPCKDGHTFRVRSARGHYEWSCVVCHFIPSERTLLLAYVEKHGGKIVP